MASDLSWNDLQLLATLAFEKADDPSVERRDQERWAAVGERVMSSAATAGDLRATAELAELDAGLQRDAKVRQRYLDLAQRAVVAAH